VRWGQQGQLLQTAYTQQQPVPAFSGNRQQFCGNTLPSSIHPPSLWQGVELRAIKENSIALATVQKQCRSKQRKEEHQGTTACEASSKGC
jgi:hypothetical protein